MFPRWRESECVKSFKKVFDQRPFHLMTSIKLFLMRKWKVEIFVKKYISFIKITQMDDNFFMRIIFKRIKWITRNWNHFLRKSINFLKYQFLLYNVILAIRILAIRNAIEILNNKIINFLNNPTHSVSHFYYSKIQIYV